MSRKIKLLPISNRAKLMLTMFFLFISAGMFPEPHGHASVKQELRIVPEKQLNSISPVADSLQILKDSVEQIKGDLIDEVDEYISFMAPKSKMSAEHIVEQCIEMDFDITLLLSQGLQETRFATCGSKNCFGLAGKKYKNLNDAVDDYISLMKRKYIINRTTDQLLESNICMENNRHTFYSGNPPAYSKKIRSIRNKIIESTEIQDMFLDIMELQQKMV